MAVSESDLETLKHGYDLYNAGQFRDGKDVHLVASFDEQEVRARL
ncbi:MAG TPA: hypothetical protein VE570_12820 [Thermoleophilaceae bacterium]|jgi:hypothetical protein|nr:hypothetical protein [Thermoleophilaceae bacterium]